MDRFVSPLARLVMASSFTILAATPTLAQRAGSTVPGDILRGEGRFLQGQGLYEMYSAKGRQIDAQTEIVIADWNLRYFEGLRREYNDKLKRQKYQSKARQEQADKAIAEKETRLRTDPTDEDVIAGDALNALLFDLSDPSIAPSAWRQAQVPLPEGLSIRSLYFRFTPRTGDKAAGKLSGHLIALGRLDPARGWPSYLPEKQVGDERKAYEAAYRRVLDQCEQDGKDLLGELGKLDRSIDSLLAGVRTKVPAERGFRTFALGYVEKMKKATEIFDAATLDFAREMIRDTHDYNPQSVGELLAFMRKYRLRFAPAESGDDGDLYRSIHQLLKRQFKELDLKPKVFEVAKSGPSPASIARAKTQLEQARTAINQLDFASIPERRAIKFRILENLDAAMMQLENPSKSGELLKAAGNDIEALRKMDIARPDNRERLARAVADFSAAIEFLKKE